MIAQPFWINSRLAIIPRPQGGNTLDDEMMALRAAGVDTVVSMLEPYEAKDLGLEQEHAAAERAGLRFLNFPIPDRSVPASLEHFSTLLANLNAQLSRGRKVGIHCRACIGRSSVVAAGLLILSGVSANKAWRQIEFARGFPVPDTRAQREWVERNIRQAAA